MPQVFRISLTSNPDFRPDLLKRVKMNRKEPIIATAELVSSADKSLSDRQIYTAFLHRRWSLFYGGRGGGRWSPRKHVCHNVTHFFPRTLPRLRELLDAKDLGLLTEGEYTLERAKVVSSFTGGEPAMVIGIEQPDSNVVARQPKKGKVHPAVPKEKKIKAKQPTVNFDITNSAPSRDTLASVTEGPTKDCTNVFVKLSFFIIAAAICCIVALAGARQEDQLCFGENDFREAHPSGNCSGFSLSDEQSYMVKDGKTCDSPLNGESVVYGTVEEAFAKCEDRTDCSGVGTVASPTYDRRWLTSYGVDDDGDNDDNDDDIDQPTSRYLKQHGTPPVTGYELSGFNLCRACFPTNENEGEKQKVSRVYKKHPECTDACYLYCDSALRTCADKNEDGVGACKPIPMFYAAIFFPSIPLVALLYYTISKREAAITASLTHAQKALRPSNLNARTKFDLEVMSKLKEEKAERMHPFAQAFWYGRGTTKAVGDILWLWWGIPFYAWIGLMFDGWFGPDYALGALCVMFSVTMSLLGVYIGSEDPNMESFVDRVWGWRHLNRKPSEFTDDGLLSLEGKGEGCSCLFGRCSGFDKNMNKDWMKRLVSWILVNIDDMLRIHTHRLLLYTPFF